MFKYSRREGTRAAVMPDQVPEPVKAERSDKLLELEKRMSREYRQGFVGTVREILLEEPAEIGGIPCVVGHTRQYVRAAVPAPVAGNTVKSAALSAGAGNTPDAAVLQGLTAPVRGRIVKARITGFLDEETLLAELIGEPG